MFCGALHEASHAVVAHVLGFEVVDVTAMPERSCCRIRLSSEIKDLFHLALVRADATSNGTTKPSEIHPGILEAMSPERLIALVAQSMAGSIAERRCHPNVTGGDQADLESEEELLAMLPDRAAAWAEANALATRLVEEYEDTILGIAARLIHEHTLSRERFLELFRILERRRIREEG